MDKDLKAIADNADEFNSERCDRLIAAIRQEASGKSESRLFVRPLDWFEIRSFLVRRRWLRSDIGEDLFDAIDQGNTVMLPVSLMREFAVWIDGYKTAKGQE